MDDFLGYFAAVSVSCGSYYVVRLLVTLALAISLPFFRKCPFWFRRFYLRWLPVLITLTFTAVLLILSVQIFDLLSNDDRILDPLVIFCYFLITVFVLLLEMTLSQFFFTVPWIFAFLQREEERPLLHVQHA